VLELKEKILKSGPPAPRTALSGAPAPVADPLEDILSALVNLGYKESQARKVLESLEIPTGATLEEVLKGALRVLVR
jgi:holliday junction DNA helicase RuvA